MNTFRLSKRTKGSISNVSNLLNALDISQDDFDLFQNLSDEERYTEKKVPKSDGSNRIVYNPHPLLRKIQRRINKRIFNQPGIDGGLIQWPSYIYGSIPNHKSINKDKHVESKDYISCAKNHCLSKSVLKLDISDFFDNIHRDYVYKIFYQLLKLDKKVSSVLTDICTLNGRVVQGALTSSYIASAVLFDVEPELVYRLSRKNLRYTRLVDDITISTKKSNFDFSLTKDLIIQMLHSKDLPINREKTSVLYASTSGITVHGLRVNFKEPRLPASEVSKIRASVKNLEILAKDPVYRVSRDYRRSYNRSLGRVNKLKRLGHSQHHVLVNRINKIVPLPNENDIKRVGKLVSKLEDKFKTDGSSYWYKRMYDRCQYELNILQRTYDRVSGSYRSRLKSIKPLIIN